jgi:hypothetical protein
LFFFFFSNTGPPPPFHLPPHQSGGGGAFNKEKEKGRNVREKEDRGKILENISSNKVKL